MTTPAAPLQHDDDGVRDFTVRRPPVQFRIDSDVFHAPNVIAPQKLRELAAAAGGLNLDPTTLTSGEGFNTILHNLAGLFRTLIGGADGKLFADRLLSPGGEGDELPIDLITQAIPVLWYLLESYGMRPTEPSLPLPTGSTDGVPATVGDGTSSTDGPEASE